MYIVAFQQQARVGQHVFPADSKVHLRIPTIPTLTGNGNGRW